VNELGKKEAMATGLAITSEGGNYNGRMTLFVILSCMMAAMGGVIFGYDIGISGTSYNIVYHVSFLLTIVSH